MEAGGDNFKAGNSRQETQLDIGKKSIRLKCRWNHKPKSEEVILLALATSGDAPKIVLDARPQGSPINMGILALPNKEKGYPRATQGLPKGNLRAT
jgi:hypothetical protein